MANTITLNGKTYDATSGKAIDGIKAVAKPAANYTAAAHKAADVHHRTQHSKTLMRSAVRKPESDKKAPAAHTTRPKAVRSIGGRLIQPSQISEMRLKRAENTQQSRLVSRFGDPAVHHISHKTEHLPVKAAPHEPISRHQVAPIIDHPMARDIFSAAIDQAISHRQTAVPKKRGGRAKNLKTRGKILSAGAVTASFLLIGGFFLWQNSANMEFRLAASKAGINATLPGYRPAGFSLKGPVEYAPGQISVRYRSNSDSRNFSLSQKASNWSSQALMENFLTANRKTYQQLEDKGRTIFIYDNSNATWVDGGIWYQIEGESELNSQQLVDIASSM